MALSPCLSCSSLQPHVVAFAPALPKLSGPPCSDSMKQDYIFIVNPKGANGNTGREWKRLFPKLSARLGKDWNVCESLTSGPLHAVDIAREAIKGGAAAVVAVGGDGTLNEVVNGFFEDGRLVQSKDGIAASRTALGLIPLGTGSDFARTLGWKNDLVESIERITKGKKRAIDVGFVKADSSLHYFINVADLHLSAKAGYHAGKYKTFGNLCYVIGALQAFMGHKDKDMNIRMDGGNWKLMSKVTSIAIGNAKYFGGGMKITPTADLSSGELEVVALQDFKWHDFLLNLPKLYKGTHISVKNVSSSRVHTIDVMEAPSSDGGALKNDTYVQADGEHAQDGRVPNRAEICRAVYRFKVDGHLLKNSRLPFQMKGLLPHKAYNRTITSYFRDL